MVRKIKTVKIEESLWDLLGAYARMKRLTIPEALELILNKELVPLKKLMEQI